MPNHNAFALLVLMVMVFGCEKTKELVSPGGDISVKTEISGDEAGPTRRLCVILVFGRATTGETVKFQTSASDVMKWAVKWHDNDTLVLYSSDIGTYAYDVTDFRIHERIANEEEMLTGREGYKEKYGRYPRH